MAIKSNDKSNDKNNHGPDAPCVPGRGPIERAYLAVQLAEAPGGIADMPLNFARIGRCDNWWSCRASPVGTDPPLQTDIVMKACGLGWDVAGNWLRNVAPLINKLAAPQDLRI